MPDLLTQTEKAMVGTDIIDAATGLSRFKSGYLVESFNDPNIIADLTAPDFFASYTGGLLSPALEKFSVELELTSTTGTVSLNGINKNKTITLPYTTIIFAQQNQSTRISNINPFSVFSWKGSLNLVPSVDNFVTINTLPPAYEVINNIVYQNKTVDIPRYWGYQPEPGANVSFAPLPKWVVDLSYDLKSFLQIAVKNHVNDQYGANAKGFPNDTNPAHWWWIP